jgi:threonine dehydratase
VEGGRLDAVRHLSRRFVAARVREVRIIRAPDLDLCADDTGTTRVWLALEALQVTGSFHVRGALVALERCAQENSRHVVAPSAGNHGIAVAYAACVLGLSAPIVVPQGVARTKCERIERYGAQLIIAKSDRYADADELARETSAATRSAFIAPCDDENLALANGASLAIEIVRRLGRVPERVLAPLVDGGLATGLAVGLAAEAASPVERSVWCVQPEARWASGAWLEDGSPLDYIDADAPTLAEELGRGLSAGSLADACAVIAGIMVAPESHIAVAMTYAYREMRLPLEGSAAIALAPVLYGLPPHVCRGDVVVVLTARNVDPERLEAALVGGPARKGVKRGGNGLAQDLIR